MTPRAATDPHTSTALSGGRRPALRPGCEAAATGERSPFFYSEPEAARDLNMSPGGLALARSRGEVDSLFETIGRRVIYSRAMVRLHACGLRTPADLGAFCKGAGILDIAALLAWLGTDEESSP